MKILTFKEGGVRWDRDRSNRNSAAVRGACGSRVAGWYRHDFGEQLIRNCDLRSVERNPAKFDSKPGGKWASSKLATALGLRQLTNSTKSALVRRAAVGSLAKLWLEPSPLHGLIVGRIWVAVVLE